MQRTVMLTGALGGLGGAVTERLLVAGWRVVAPVRDASRGEELLARPAVSEVSGRLELVECDLLDAGSTRQCAQQAGGDPHAPLGALVNLAGGFAAGGRVHETPVEAFESQLRINLRPTYNATAAALPHLLEGGGGAVVCVAARAARHAFSGAAGYIASKAAVLAFVDALTAEYRADGVRANAVLPSVIDTPANRSAQPDADHSRWVSPEEIAAVIDFLCSPTSEPVSGAHVPVYGRA